MIVAEAPSIDPDTEGKEGLSGMGGRRHLLLPGGEGAELACFGDAVALAGGDVLLPLDRRAVDHKVLVVIAGSHGCGRRGVQTKP